MSKKKYSSDNPNTFKNYSEDEKETVIVKSNVETPLGSISRTSFNDDADPEPQDEPEERKRKATIRFLMKIVVPVVVILGLIFAILKLSYYIHACAFISGEGNFRMFSLDVDQYADINLGENYDDESTRSYLVGLIIASIVVELIYIIVHCVLFYGAKREDLFICLGWCISVGVLILIRVIIILCAPLVMFQYLGIEIVFEVVGIGFILLNVWELRILLKKKENKISPVPTEIFMELEEQDLEQPEPSPKIIEQKFERKPKEIEQKYEKKYSKEIEQMQKFEKRHSKEIEQKFEKKPIKEIEQKFEKKPIKEIEQKFEKKPIKEIEQKFEKKPKKKVQKFEKPKEIEENLEESPERKESLPTSGWGWRSFRSKTTPIESGPTSTPTPRSSMPPAITHAPIAGSSKSTTSIESLEQTKESRTQIKPVKKGRRRPKTDEESLWRQLE